MTDSNKYRAQRKAKAEAEANVAVEEISQGSPETTPVEAASAAPQQNTVQVMSQVDTFVSDLVKEQPVDIAELETRERKMQNILELPEECAKLHKVKYRYRWMAKTKNLEAKLRTGIWSLCTRQNSPYIKPHRFKTHGAVEQAGMLLAFTTEAMGQKREQEPADKSAQLVKHYTKDLPSREEAGFYKPKDTGEAEDTGEGFEMEY